MKENYEILKCKEWIARAEELEKKIGDVFIALYVKVS